jgi:hypothetical protein
MKLICLYLLCFLASNSFSQVQKVKEKELKKVTFSSQNTNNNPDSVIVSRDYVLHPEKMKIAFISGVVPDDVPKYDNSKTYKENVEIAKAWARKHKHLIREEYWSKFEN